jgi:2,3-dihydroxybenzoate-AMP ligase
MTLEGFIEAKKEDTARYLSEGSWGTRTLADMLDDAARDCPDKEALADVHRRFTYSELSDTTRSLASGLTTLGVGRGDPVLLQLPNWNEFVLSLFALFRIGAPAVLLLPRHRQVEINHFCELTKAKAWILPERYRSTDYSQLIDDVMGSNPSLKQVITVRAKESRFTRLEDLIGTEKSSHGQKGATLHFALAGDLAFVIATGGTTGLPKAVPRTHNDALCEAAHKSAARRQNGDDVCMISVPLEHNLGLASLHGIMSVKGKNVLVDSTRAEDLCSTIQRERVTCAPLVPTLLARLVSFEGMEKYDLSSLKALYVGGAKTPVDVIKATRQRLGNVYTTAFGMSEGPSCTTGLDDAEDVVLSSIGKPCCQFDDFRVVGPDGRSLPPQTEGELQAKGPGMFSGYLGNAAENSRAFTPDGYFRTGDLARIDNRGNIWITGRIKDIIIRGGEKISPAEIEAMLRQHPAVADVAVVPMPDAEMGEKACAYVKPRGKATPTLEELVSFLKSKGASVLQLPERVETISKMPLTKVGKVDKKALESKIRKVLDQ